MVTRERFTKRYWYTVDYQFGETDRQVEPFLHVEASAFWLKRAREALMLSAESVADKMGVARTTYSKFERNEDRINFVTLRRAAEAMDCELVYAIRPKQKILFSERVWRVLCDREKFDLWDIRMNMYFPAKRRKLGFRTNCRGMDPDVRQYANGCRSGDTNICRNISFPSQPKRCNLHPMIKILATWFGCGLAPKAPGTFGSIGALPLVIVLALFLPPIPYMLVTVAFAIGAIFVAQLYEAETGRHDDKEVVIDEVAGMLVTMAWVPMTWTYILAGFLLFRLFDVWKPFPISYIDKKVQGGVGCVGDDLIAGILSNIILQAILQQGWFT